MDKRRAGSVAAIVGAVIMVIAVLHPSWWVLRAGHRDDVLAYGGEVRGTDVMSIGPRNYGVLGKAVESDGTAALVVAGIAVALCLAVALGAYWRRVPFILAMLATLGAGAFAFTPLVLGSDFPEFLRGHYERGPGVLFAVLGGLVGLMGSLALASWSWTPEARQG